jgi:hypothetical protein
MQTKIEMAIQFFMKFSSTKYHENPFCGSQVIHACVQIEWAKLIGASETCKLATIENPVAWKLKHSVFRIKLGT